MKTPIYKSSTPGKSLTWVGFNNDTKYIIWDWANSKWDKFDRLPQTQDVAFNTTIKSAIVLISDGADKISLIIDLPESCYPFVGNSMLTMNAARGTGIEYVRKHLGIEPEVIECVDARTVDN